MKVGISLVILLLVWVVAFTDLRPAYAETIYAKDGRQIKAKISEKTEMVIWYEITTGDMGEYVGIDISGVEKVLNDDGSVSEYSPIRTEVAE